MAQAPDTHDSRERAVSSEPCSTRPNPFDDSDISSRKRQRTSLSGASRSLSVDTVHSEQGSHVAGDPAAEPQGDSVMNIDSAPAAPATPEAQQTPSSPPASAPRSSRMTINVRTPSRPLETIPSSPLPGAPDLAAHNVVDAVHASVEEAELNMLPGDRAGDALALSSSDSGSPPVEEVDESEDDGLDPDIEILGELLHDPSPSYPFYDTGESFPETISRCCFHILTYELIARNFSKWMDQYVAYTSQLGPVAVERSYREHQYIWASLPELTMFVLKNREGYSRGSQVGECILSFHKSFARLTAVFLAVDLNTIENTHPTGQDFRYDMLVSLPYVHTLELLTRRGEESIPPILANGEVDWDDFEWSGILHAFMNTFAAHWDGPRLLKRLIAAEAGLISRLPKLIEHMTWICQLTCNIATVCRSITKGDEQDQGEGDHARGNLPDQRVLNQARGNLILSHEIFKITAEALQTVIDNHVNHLTIDTTAMLLSTLMEIYQVCLGTPHALTPELEVFHQRCLALAKPTSKDLAALHSVIGLRWKLSFFVRLIMSSQMQLRVWAVTNMCNDLVAIHKRYGGPSATVPYPALMGCIADYLSQTELIPYILGPNCHPEVTIESSNVIGFLMVTGTYQAQHIDALWQTVTSTQDPRVADALIRSTERIINLCQYDTVIYFCEKMTAVPLESCGIAMQGLCHAVFKTITSKAPGGRIAESAPYDLCIRLIREASVFGAHSSTAYLDLHQLAIAQFPQLLHHGPTPECRQKIYSDCLEDIGAKSPFTIGSLWILTMLLRAFNNRDLKPLATEHNLARLLTEELGAAIPRAQRAGFPAVLSGPRNSPRKEMFSLVISLEPQTLDTKLGARLWYFFVGSGASCQEDRDEAWRILNNASKRTERPSSQNPFLLTCFSKFLPTLEPECFCLGALEFVRERVLPLVDKDRSGVLEGDASSILDAESGTDSGGIDQLWRMILTAPAGTIENQAICTLVDDIYIRSRDILARSHHSARKVHLAFVDRCLRQMSSAAAYLKELESGTTNGNVDSRAVLATDQRILEQELVFVRSLSVLSEFHRLYQEMPQFSAPDLRPLMASSPEEIEGEPAGLKYQSFDGDTQTEVKPLTIGNRNTAASLLASLREVTGFNNYRIYYRGRQLTPREGDICKSLEFLKIQNGLILVKRDSDTPASPTRPQRVGTSFVEVEILNHFAELWDYLAMKGYLAQEIYKFLVKLPTDENTLRTIENPSTPYRVIFPPKDPLKSLYAVHALIRARRDNLQTTPPKSSIPSHRVFSLVVSAISDHEVLDSCSDKGLQLELSSLLLQCFLVLLKEHSLPLSVAAQSLDAHFLDRLLVILSKTLSNTLLINTPDSGAGRLQTCLQSIFDSCSTSQAFMSAFCDHEEVPRILERILLDDPRAAVRQSAAAIIAGKLRETLPGPGTTTDQFRSFFWPLIFGWVRPAVTGTGVETGAEVLELCLEAFRVLRDARSQILNMQEIVDTWIELLLGYTTSEDLTQPQVVDRVAYLLTDLLHTILCVKDPSLRHGVVLPNIARSIFWTHLFYPFEKGTSNRPIISPQTRSLLVDIIFEVIDGDRSRLGDLLVDLDKIVGIYREEDDPYQYELPWMFERSKAIRDPCGYAGLKNLGNTCYVNSLFTQLFMNTDFRSFMLNAHVSDARGTQALLFHTQKLFAFMQDSLCRYIDPEYCIGEIKTIEGGLIDITVQMDVDEFFNLLFDRWEEQFSNNEDKRHFRSIYGGQLVQQVASKECEHVSEKLEPFFTIQCDIKGKNSLQESLRAYVDGEIMEGDNKYKCSRCDRHVDAVKRACLKDIPDNLIFHLKRFEFNIRALQRSKINDYFTFPMQIDMRPYTSEHINGTSSSEATEEDIFELVGVLVHAGNAESGHYYSYIRERPSRSEKPTWIEFNDDMVSTWDPAMMQAACFGGPDLSGKSASFEKSHSAYMLFYQRSSSVSRSQQLLDQQLQCRSPLRVQLPRGFANCITADNHALTRRHCLYDPNQISFVNRALYYAKTMTVDGHDPHKDQAIHMALSHLDQVASRTKDIPDFSSLSKRIGAMCQACVHCSLSVWQYLCDQYPHVLRAMVQRNPEIEVRQETAKLVLLALDVIKERIPEQYGIPTMAEYLPTILERTVHAFRYFWEQFHASLRSWPEVFGLMLEFVKMGHYELAEYLRTPYLEKLLMILYADINLDMPQNFARMISAVMRRGPSKPTHYEAIIGLVDALSCEMAILYNRDGEFEGYELTEREVEENNALEPRPRPRPRPYTIEEARIIHLEWVRGQGSILVDKLISINQNSSSTHSIIRNLMKQGRILEDKIFRTLKVGITGQSQSQAENAPYLRVASQVFCRFASREGLVRELVMYVARVCGSLQSNEGKAFLDFFREVASQMGKNPVISDETALEVVYDSMIEWAPALLGYEDMAVAIKAEELVHELVFKVVLMDADGDEERTSKAVERGKDLGYRCLAFLRDRYITLAEPVAKRLVLVLERTARECSKLYGVDEADEEHCTTYLAVMEDILENIRGLTADDEVEDDGSDWEASSDVSMGL